MTQCRHCGTRTGVHGFSFEYDEQENKWDIKSTVCVSHLRFVPCRANSGCVIRMDDYAVNIVRLYQQSHITKPEAYSRLED